MRDRLIDPKEYAAVMRKEAVRNENGIIQVAPELWEQIASLIERAIIPPCDVGDTTYLLLERCSGGFDIHESKCVCVQDNGYGEIYSMYFDCPQIGNTLEFSLEDFGKTVFLNREDAEAALSGESEVDMLANENDRM